MGSAFSSKQRADYLEEMSKHTLDLLVIGGGITGAGIALDAQVRGIHTGLIEMQDYAAGTSSRSTKLVHGGLRYLKQFEVKLVAEVGKERAIVYENAPHVTTPEWMLLPMIQGGTFGKTATSIGLKVYDYLAGVRKEERRKMLSKSETLQKEPLIRSDKLKGGGIYVEYRTDDARLTLEVLKEAVDRGTKAVNYAKAEEFIYENGKVIGVKVRDVLSSKLYSIYAKKIVNAAGPWVDTLREKDNSKKGKYLHLTKGVHLVIDGSRFPLKQAVYFDTENDKRMVFAIPRDGKTYIGTTDTFYNDEIAHPRMTEEDRDYIIAACNYMFPTVHLTVDDIESSWTGLRPLIHEEGKSASEISRKDEIFFSDTGLISIAGGKLTGYRKMAERIVDIVGKDLGNTQSCTTAHIKLSGGDVGGADQFEYFVSKMVAEGEKLGLSKEDASRLVYLYGSNVTKVYEIIKNHNKDADLHRLPITVFAQLKYGIEEEMVSTPIDFFNRRTGALFFNMKWVKQWKNEIVAYMKKELKWTEEQVVKYVTYLESEIYYAQNPVDGSKETVQKAI
ncbi:glycerol-3-phosphate dehydrogenase/oxidase [Alkalihalobacterium chitinilyticum]|uniref:Glycerol-3-phosphate dehydrogenase n=1 Tax=Alkalihalobacterium chitinilyticum TaxID=2980103 RepID=A0ABT5VD59_9BACI|nr:glycerol-3-phosphate dehydrogenase/oxidase [Alkalihalobacterium chitinilyticum]MDE5413373.1 glycerol-3-phosphate dehydrogenase/oxidase [Alkalihalobacterium chitinilyticum]